MEFTWLCELFIIYEMAPYKPAKWFTPKVCVAWLTICNFVNYVDRGIIAGAGTCATISC